MSGPQARRDQSLEAQRSDVLLPASRRHADPLGDSEARAQQSSALVKQNEFLKAYVSRLQRALQESSAGSFPAPPDPSTVSPSDAPPTWGADPTLLSPLLSAYDRRIAEADRVNDRVAAELSSLQARAKLLTQDNERLVGEVRHLTELAVSRLEDATDAGAGGGGLVSEERNAVLQSENEALVEEAEHLRVAMQAAQREVASLKQQCAEKDEQNAVLRAKLVSSELRDAEMNAAREVFGSADVRLNEQRGGLSGREERLQVEIEACQRELRVVQDELQTSRADLRSQVKANGELRQSAESLARQLSSERDQQAKDMEEARVREVNRVQALKVAQSELEELKSRRGDEAAFVEELKKQLDDLDKTTRTQEQKLSEARTREDMLKGQCRRLEESADDAQLASDQAQALEQQARREITRLSDKLRQVLVEAQTRSEETVMSIRQKYKGQKAHLQEQITQLEISMSELRTQNDRLQRDNASLESEMDKISREGPGGNIGRLQREIDDLNRRWRETSAERDSAVHQSKATELAARRQQANWEQEHLQAQEQIAALQRQVKKSEEKTRDLNESTRNALAESQAVSRREKNAVETAERMEKAFEERMSQFSKQCRAELSEMEDKVRRAEEAEAETRGEMQDLLEANDVLQGKWRNASKDLAVQSQRVIEELSTEKARLEARNKELNNKLANILVEQAGQATLKDSHERQVGRMRVLLDAAEKRAVESTQQVADLVRSEAVLLEERKEATFASERARMELERTEKALDEAKETVKQLRAREWDAATAASNPRSFKACFEGARLKRGTGKAPQPIHGSDWREGHGHTLRVREC